MVKIKLLPTGKKHAIQYRVVVAEENSKLTGSPVDLLGTYQTKPEKLNLDTEKLQAWLAKGAQLTPGVRRILPKQQDS